MNPRCGLPTWRLILDPPGDPLWNMAVDEALLRGPDGAGGDPITLRLYAWNPPAVSLGRFQPPLPPGGEEFCRAAGIAVVRRPTGGAGVLHAEEITYSLSAPIGAPPFPRSVVRIYERIAGALQRGLRRLGVATEARGAVFPSAPQGPSVPCFARIGRWEICWRGRKLLGSAQARYRGRFLQHGSIPLDLDRQSLLRAFGEDPKRWEDLPAVSLAEAMGRYPRREEVAEAVVRGFQEEFRVRFRRGSLSEGERDLSRRIRPARSPGFRPAIPGHSRWFVQNPG